MAACRVVRHGRFVLRGRTGLRAAVGLARAAVDAGHMAADVVALGAALVATRIATRPDTTGRRTYGSYRAEVFASAGGAADARRRGYIVVEAVGRIGGDAEVSSGPMLVVGGVGLAVNVVALLLLRGGASESLNVKGAYLEVVADTAGSVGVIVAGWLVAATGRRSGTPLVALAIGAFVAVRAVRWAARSSPCSASTCRRAWTRPPWPTIWPPSAA